MQPRNGYNQYYFALDSTFLEAKLTRPREGQMLEAEAKILASRPYHHWIILRPVILFYVPNTVLNFQEIGLVLIQLLALVCLAFRLFWAKI